MKKVLKKSKEKTKPKRTENKKDFVMSSHAKIVKLPWLSLWGADDV